MIMVSARPLGLLASAVLALALASGQNSFSELSGETAGRSKKILVNAGLKAGKIDEAKKRIKEAVQEHQSFDPIHHRRDFAILLSVLGVVTACIKGAHWTYCYLKRRTARVTVVSKPGS